MQVNQQMHQLSKQQSQSIEDLRLQVGQLKQQLISYSNLLEIYVEWLLGAGREQSKQVSSEALQILEARAVL
jgi:hypothetical protein